MGVWYVSFLMKRVLDEYFTHLLCVFGGFWLGTQSQPGKHECRIKHSSNAVTKKLYPLLSTTHKDGNTSCRAREAQSGFEPEPFVLWWNYLGCSGLMSEGVQVTVVWVYRYGWDQFGSTLCISKILLLSCYCLQVPHQPFNPQQTSSSAVFWLRVSVQPLTCFLQRSPRGRFDAWFTVHVLIIQFFRHLPGGSCCSTLPSTHN